LRDFDLKESCFRINFRSKKRRKWGFKMKNRNKHFGAQFGLLITAFSALVIGTILGCASMTLVSLDTAEGPKQVRQGLDINPGDITLYGIYKDESRKTVNLKSENIVFDKHTPGTQTVKVRISKLEASFQTQVMPLNSLTAAFQPIGTLYTGDTPDSKWPGLEIRGEWEQMGGGTIDAASCRISGYNKEQAGRQTLTVSFEGKTASFNVTVTPSHPLRGDWVQDWDGPSHGLITWEFKNDGTYSSGDTRTGTTSDRGTYTTSPPSASEGKITMTRTHVPGKDYTDKYGCLPIMLYTRENMEIAIRLTEANKEEGQRMTDAQINVVLNGIYSSRTRDYAIKDGKLFFDGEEKREGVGVGVIGGRGGFVRR